MFTLLWLPKIGRLYSGLAYSNLTHKTLIICVEVDGEDPPSPLK